MNEARHIPAIDGLRALAIVAVVIYHINKKLLPGGYLGVDMFFVISGFLITRIIVTSACSEAGFSFVAFYERRVRRILPAAVVLVVVFAAVAQMAEGWSSARFIYSQITPVLLSYSNIENAKHAGDYFSTDSEAYHFLHTWSLSIEEQFYLILPAVLVVLKILFGYRRLFAMLLITFLLSAFSFGYYRIDDPIYGFYNLFNRSWELLLGSLASIWLMDRRPIPTRGISTLQWLALGLIVSSLFIDASRHPKQQVLIAMGVCGASGILLASFASNGLMVNAGLEWKPILWIGRVSYSAYLWHWPLIVLVRNHTESPWLSIPERWALFLTVGSIVLSTAISYYAVERPFRHWQWSPRLFLPLALMIGAVLEFWKSKEPPVGLDYFKPVIVFGNRFCYNPTLQELGNLSPLVYFPKPIVRNSARSPNGRSEILLFGNSHGLSIAPMVDRLAETNGLQVEHLFANGVSPSLFRDPGPHGGGGMSSAEVDRYDATRRSRLKRRPALCILCMRYDIIAFEDMEKTIDAILQDTRLLIVQQAPVLNIGDVNAVERFDELVFQAGSSESLAVSEPRKALQGRREFEGKLLGKYGSNSRFRFLETQDLFRLENGNLRWNDGGRGLFYFDDDHLSDLGVQLYEKRVMAAIRELLGRGSK